MEMILLENEALRVQISPLGAELHSIVTKSDGREHLWHGDPAVWRKRAPWLFPLIGQLRGGAYRYAGETYDTMPMHGFASTMEFAVMQPGAEGVLLTLRATDETLKMYPWHFVLEIAYVLEGDALKIRCRVRSEDRKDMYFSFGAHPGFACQPGDTLTFDDAEKLECLRLNLDTHLLEYASSEIGEKIDLQEDLFDADAMLLRAPACEGATLRRADGTGVRFDFGRVPWVGVWTRAHGGLPYICVEPWHGVDDPVDAQGDIEQKLDIQRVGMGETFAMDMTIRPLSSNL